MSSLCVVLNKGETEGSAVVPTEREMFQNMTLSSPSKEMRKDERCRKKCLNDSSKGEKTPISGGNKKNPEFTNIYKKGRILSAFLSSSFV